MKAGIHITLLLFLGFSAGLCASAAPDAWADSGNIEVTDLGAESRYPSGIRFFVAARSPQIVDEIRVFMNMTRRFTAGAYRVLEFEAGEAVSAETILHTGAAEDYIPPGTRIRYSFEIRDRAGGVYRTPDQEVVYSDARFDWGSISSGLATVYYYGEGGQDRAQQVLNAALEAIQRMATVLGIDPAEPFRVVSYNSYTEMAPALPLSYQVLQGEVHTQGMAFGDEGVALVQASVPTMRGIVSHEVTHLVTAEAARRAYNRMPAWLKEGLAEYGNIQPTDEYEQALARGIRNGQLKPLQDLNTFGSATGEVVVAYGQSQSVVKHLIDSYGEEKVAELMEVLQSSVDIDQALERVYGFDQHGLDARWREAMALEPLATPGGPHPRSQGTPTPAPTPTPTLTPTPTPAPTPARPAPSPTPAPTPTRAAPSPTPAPTPAPPSPTTEPPEAAPEKAGGPDGSSPGCGAADPTAGAPGEPALLALLVGPVAMLAFRKLRFPRGRSRGPAPW